MEELIKIEVVNGKPCVTSLQVAEAFGKEHKNVLADIRKILEDDKDNFGALNFQLLSYSKELGDGITREYPMYVMTKDGFILLAMGYTGEEAMKLKKAYIKRFNEMDAQLHGIALPQTYLEALRALTAAVELKEAEKQQRLLAELQRDEAIRRKAEIGSRREATSMATASVAVRQRDALADRIGEGRKWKTVKAIPWLMDEFCPSRGMYSQVGRKLSEMSQRMGYPVHRVEDSSYGEVKAYHIAVIASFHTAIRKDRNMLGKYRRAA